MGTYLPGNRNVPAERRPSHDAAVTHAANADHVAPSGDASTTLRPTTSNGAQSSNSQYTVFISHAGEDKATVAMPLRELLLREGISAFVDEADMPAGTDAQETMTYAMETASIGVVVLSPEFVARKWPMRELMHFLKRREDCRKEGREPPTIVPFFYRLRIDELYDEPRLDRRDKDGHSLYERSRFYERRRNREPEASVAGIKLALKTIHGIMGIRNDVDATNDSSLLMRDRREILLKKLCNDVCQAVQKTAGGATTTRQTRTGAGHDLFQAHFDTSNEVSNLVLNFDRVDENGSRCTQEGQVLQMLLDTSEREKRTVAVFGVAGAGKTSLLEGIRNSIDVRTRFPDGVYYLPMGSDATRGKFIEMLSRAVEKSGGEERAKRMRSESDKSKVMEEFRSWFEGKQCLFVVDDVWKTEEISSGVIHDLFTLHTSGRSSKVLLTTRSREIAARAESPFRLEAREVLSEESRAILYRYSGLKPGVPREEHVDENNAVDTVLHRCGGLPLLLAVSGRAVRALTLGSGNKGCLAYRGHCNELERCMKNVVNAEIDNYEGLAARLMISVRLLEERRTKIGFGMKTKLGIAEMHRRLCVMTKQARVPMSMLVHVWELVDEGEATGVAKELEQVGLADVELGTWNGAVVETLRLHDSVHEFAVCESGKCDEEGVGHEALIRGYGSKLNMTPNMCRKWWSTSMAADGYIHANLCRHLVACDNVREVTQLLLRPQWVERQLEVSGMLIVDADFCTGIKAIREEIGSESNRGRKELEEALQLIREALRLSSGFVSRNKRELWFQLHGRLHGHRERNRLVKEYVEWIEGEAPRPRILSKNRFLVEAGGPNTKTFSVGRAVKCMVLLQDSGRVVCDSEDGSIVVASLRQSEVETQWKAHDDRIESIAGMRDGTRVVSGSNDKSAKVWEVESGRCIARFDGHEDEVKCVAMTEDGKWAASCDWGGTFQVWEADTGQPVTKRIESHHGSVFCIAFVRDRKRVVTGGRDRTIRIWDTATGAQDGAPFEGHSSAVVTVAIFPDKKRLVSGSGDGTVRVWDVESRQQIREFNVAAIAYCVAVSADESRVICGTGKCEIAVFDMNSEREVCDPLFMKSGLVSGVEFLEDADTMVSCSTDGNVRVWDVSPGEEEKVSDQHNGIVVSVCFTPNSKFVVSGSWDKSIRIWDAETGESVGSPLQGHTGFVYGVAVTPDGRFVVSVSTDWTVRVWDLARRSLLHTFTGHTGVVMCVAITPKGNRAVTGSEDGTIRVWNLQSMDGSHVVLEGPTGIVLRVFIADDGLRVISVDSHSNVLVWDVRTKTIRGHTNTGLPGPYIFRATRNQILGLSREPVSLNDPSEFQRPIFPTQFVLDEGTGASVLGTLDDPIQSWGLSPDGKTICAGLYGGQVAVLKLEMSAGKDFGCVIS